jgi:hypothetical protein
LEISVRLQKDYIEGEVTLPIPHPKPTQSGDIPGIIDLAEKQKRFSEYTLA